jgi:isopentenyl phosphate kinase
MDRTKIFIRTSLLFLPMYLVKLGGSVITEKKELRSFRQDVARRLLGEVKESGKQVVLVHGAGSFGHILASKYGLKDGFSDAGQVKGVSKVQYDVRELNMRMMRLAGELGLNPVSIPPAATVVCKSKSISHVNTEPFESAVKLGMTPVTFGDVVFDSEIGFCICSGDDLMLHLAKTFKPEKVVFVADTDGIFDANPKKHGGAKLLKFVDQGVLDRLKIHGKQCESCRKDVGGDATGGMLRKIEIMLQISQLGIESLILNGLQPARLRDCLSGKEAVGTVVRAKGTNAR